MLPKERALPIGQSLGLGHDLVEADRYDHEVHQQIGPTTATAMPMAS